MAEGKQIICIESSPTDMLAKMNYVLRKRGYHTMLLSLTGDIDNPFIKEAYDKRMSLDLKFFKIMLGDIPKIVADGVMKSHNFLRAWFIARKLKPALIICRANPNWLCFLAKNFFGSSPFIYFPYDIRSFCYETFEEAIASGVPKFEIHAERYCFENADGIIHKGAEDELEFISEKVLRKEVHLHAPTLHFQPYCLKELMVHPKKSKKASSQDNQFHIVNAGHLETVPKVIEGVQQLTQQNIHFHAYTKTANIAHEEVSKKIRESYREIIKSPYFHIHAPADQKTLAHEISKYDYGIAFGPDEIKKNLTLCTTHRISSYLEAGLPVICLKRQRTISDFVMRNHIGLSTEFSEFGKLKKILEKQNYKKLVQNVLKVREKYEMHEQVPRLEYFFQEVIKKRHNSY